MTDCDEYVEDTYTSTLRRKSGRLLIETRPICADIPGARSVRKDCTHALFVPESSVVIERKIKSARKLTFFFFFRFDGSLFSCFHDAHIFFFLRTELMKASNRHRCQRPKKGAKSDNERSQAQAC